MGLLQVVWLGLLAVVARTQELQDCSVDNSSVTVGSTEDATALADFLQCSNGNFTVQWMGHVLVRETVHISNGTFLNITGAGPGAIADGGDATQIFVVDGGSRVHFSDMTLTNGTASNGGAIYVEQSSVSFSGNTSLISNSAGVDGGAIHATYSSVSWDGDDIEFVSNSAGGNGGAIHAADESSVYWDGDGIEFISNNAGGSGGAIHAVDESSVSWDGDGTDFSNNFGNHGGAICANGSSTVSWNGDDTQFIYNSAGANGGAIMAGDSSNASWYGDRTQFSYNSAYESGGTIFANGRSTVSWFGHDTQFSNNSAGSDGGAIMAADTSTVSWFGDDTHFSFNSALWYGNGDDTQSSYMIMGGGSGGAIYASFANISWNGNGTVFSSNSAGGSGGALSLLSSHSSWKGSNTEFSFNSAGSGGAISVFRSNMSWYGDRTQLSFNSAAYFSGGGIYAFFGNIFWYGDGTHFSFNSASQSGGAIDVGGSDISWYGDDTLFSYNSALDFDGGAIYSSSSTVVWGNNSTQFSSNYAKVNGGAIYALGSILSNSEVDGQETSSDMYSEYGAYAIYVDDITGYSRQDNTRASWGTYTIFVGNKCEGSGGALYIESPDLFYLAHTTFHNNSASITGGAVALMEAVGDFPPVFSKCNFSENVASGSGGAVEAVSGNQEFYSCDFEGNSADVGGAMRIGGSTLVVGCSFFSNLAYTRGLAVTMVGSASISGSSFYDNQLSCAAGSYRNDTEHDDVNARFEMVCFDCPTWDECLDCNITGRNATSACEEPLVHTSADEDGVTLETLNINAGFWRATNESDDIRACYNADACTGGITGSNTFCASAYKGPCEGGDCAVCETGHFPSLGHTCTRCSSSTRRGLMAATVIAALFVLLAIVGSVKYLLSVQLEEGNVEVFHRWILRAIPVQALKIIVVVWQIVTQFAEAANATYPGVYQDFLSAIDVANFDLGSVLAAGCFWSDFDFHDRLLVGTIGPLVVVGFLATTYRIAIHRSGTSDHTAAVFESVRHKHQTALLLLTFLVYSSTSSTVFQTFACETLDDGIEYLRADYRIHCTDAKHKAFGVYAGVMVFVYPLGIPLLYAVLLYQRRDVLADSGAEKTTARPISVLWEPYTPDRFYYEVIECVRRVMLTGVVVFIYPNDAAQIAITILSVFFFFALFEMLAPYKSESDMWLSRGGHVIVFLSMFYLLMLKVDVSSESGQSQAVFAGVLVTGHVLMLLTIVVEVIAVAYSSRKKRVVEESPENLPGFWRRAGPDESPVFESAPAMWGSFRRQGSVSAKIVPTRQVTGTVATVGRP